MIDTERLVLRPYEAGDVPSILALAADPAVRRFIGNLPDSEEAAWARVLRCAGHWSLFGFGSLAVVERASGSIVGEVGAGFFRRAVDPELDSLPEVSWLFSSEVGGRGLAFEAMAGLLRWLEASTRHDRVACLIEPINLPSLRLAEKLGFSPVRHVAYRERPFLLLTSQTTPLADDRPARR
ncbi:Protein N-acetyltransferase, RimJ/RimL family [Sphingomonas sp. NFR04]|uniref:GNAT family N-acetyltransferase n=1 Tax=Sphingomonas sp. NFR04 TaxID=1566283 RepID=UPI0008EEBF76|nr:GNAT family N-acetyltransferase [Sphingomonas sp. NFR04]SFJ09123.1 Protein N-acetyltransferase, RimJ/RimL family [Sphingomonas sp. NFR04]